MNKNWQDMHFKRAADAPKRLDESALGEKSRGGTLLALVTLTVCAGASVVGADYMGYLNLGIFARPEPVAIAHAEPAAPSAPVVAPEPQLPSQPVSLPPEVIAAPAPDPAKARQLQEKIAQLDRGLNLMGRDVAEVRAQETRPRWELRVRPLPTSENRGDDARTQPFTAAERVLVCEEYARNNPGMNSQTAYAVNNARNVALADLANARKRLKELTDKEASLQGRIDKAQRDLAQVQAP